MKKVFALFISVLFLFSIGACKKKGENNYYYPKYHFANLKTKEGKETSIYLNWGEKLEISDPDGKEKVTVKHKNQNETLLKTKRILDGSEGYIFEKDVEIRPLHVGVILRESLVYGAPSETDRSKQAVKTATLAYVIAKKGGEKDPKEQKWFKIKCYFPYPPSDYKLALEADPIYGEKWIKAEDISIQERDVNLIVGIHMSLKNFRKAKADFDNNKDPKFEKKLGDVAAAEKLSIENLISSNMESEAIKYARQALDIISGNEVNPANLPKPEEVKAAQDNNETQKNNDALKRANEGD